VERGLVCTYHKTKRRTTRGHDNITTEEIPKLPIAGTETGTATGLGPEIYVDASQRSSRDHVPRHLLAKSGAWKNSVEIRRELEKLNPALKRSRMIKANSGRYVFEPQHAKGDKRAAHEAAF